MKKFKINLSFLRILSNIWGILTFLFFIFDFFSNQLYKNVTTSSAVIYGVVLACYVGNKEFKRWQSKHQYKSMHFGEIYPIAWSIAMIVFVIISFFSHGKFRIPSEFPATYITILGIYIISQQSKVIYSKKR